MTRPASSWTCSANGSATANFTPLEEAAALFAAHEAGASRTRIRKSTGRKAAEVKTALAAAALPADAGQRPGADQPADLDELALLAEFQATPKRSPRLAAAACGRGYDVEYAAERIRQDRAEAAEHERLRAELDAAGFTVTDGLPDGAHAWPGCCTTARTSPPRRTPPARAGACTSVLGPAAPRCTTAPTRPSTATPPATARPPHAAPATGPPGHARRRRPAGRRPARPGPPAGDRGQQGLEGRRPRYASRWLAASLFARRTAPREAAQFVARQLLAMPEPLRSGLAAAPRQAACSAELTGHDAGPVAGHLRHHRRRAGSRC